MISVERLSQRIGARVSGIDCKNPVPDDDLNTLKMALAQHQLLYLPDQNITREEFLSFGKIFGHHNKHSFHKYHDTDLKGINVIDSQDGTRSDYWHSDSTVYESSPVVNLLRPEIIPPIGGDTLFINLVHACSLLSPTLQDALAGLTGIHDMGHAVLRSHLNEFAVSRTFDSEALSDLMKQAIKLYAEHPLIYKDSRDGRNSLCVNPAYLVAIKGLHPAESTMILGFLNELVLQPHLVYRHSWREGDLLIWDNRRVLHRGDSDFSGRRVMLNLMAYESSQ